MTREEIRWVLESAVVALHDAQLAEHGGAPGVRDESLLLSALARPRHLAAYGTPDLADLAAACAVGIARNHAFIDGNKRIAIVVAGGVFLPLNGYEVIAANEDIVRTMRAVAEGSLSEQQLAVWFRQRMRPIADAP